MQTANWISLVTAIIAAAVAVASLVVNLRSASKRDLQNWRRTTLSNALSELIATSLRRYELASSAGSSEVQAAAKLETRKMEASLNLIEICMSDGISKACDEIVSEHRNSDSALTQLRTYTYQVNNHFREHDTREFNSTTDRAQMSMARLEQYHINAVESAQKEFRLKR